MASDKTISGVRNSAPNRFNSVEASLRSHMATRKIYYEDQYLASFEAKVIQISGTELLLDATAFYPSGGGQTYDTGEIEGIKVIGVRKEDDVIVHSLERQPSLAIGDTVSCSLDWPKRYRTMRLHSAAHLVYYVMKEFFETEPASSGLVDDQKDRNDYVFEAGIDRSRLELVNGKVNELIKAAWPVSTWQEGEIRFWKIDPYPAMKCAGTHVRNLDEIGPVEVRRGKKPGKGKERIETTLLRP